MTHLQKERKGDRQDDKQTGRGTERLDFRKTEHLTDRQKPTFSSVVLVGLSLELHSTWEHRTCCHGNTLSVVLMVMVTL